MVSKLLVVTTLFTLIFSMRILRKMIFGGGRGDNGKTVWSMLTYKEGDNNSTFWQWIRGYNYNAGLSEGTYTMTNNWKWPSDISIHSKGKPFKLFLNVSDKKLYITVVKGEIILDNLKLSANPTMRYPVMNASVIRVDDVKLQFSRIKEG